MTSNGDPGSHGLQIHVSETGFIPIAEWRRSDP